MNIGIYPRLKPNLIWHIASIDQVRIGILNQLAVGDLLRLDFNGLIVSITSIKNDSIILKVISAGSVGHNKGADCLNRTLDFNDFTSKDLEALAISNQIGINRIFISFCQSINPVNKVRKLIPNSWICSNHVYILCTFIDGNITRTENSHSKNVSEHKTYLAHLSV